MAKLWFSRADVANLFRLKNTEALDRLERAGVLEITAYTTSGRPLYSAEAVLRAAKSLRGRPESSEPSPR